MNLIIQLLIGAVIGWLASIVMKTNAQMGAIANIVIGIVGAGVGGFLATSLGVASGGAAGFLFAVAGAALLIFLLKAVGVFK